MSPAALVLAAALVMAAIGCGESRAPDVIIVTVDTLRADHSGAYGHPELETAAIDGLAARGARFEHAYVPQPRTTPALASLFTGLEPHRHGSVAVGRPIREGTLLAQRFSTAGWTTLGVSRSAVATERQGFDRGFDRFVSGKQASPVTRTSLEWAAAADPERPLFLWVHYLDPHFPYRPDARRDDDAECLALADAVRNRELRTRAVFQNLGGRAEAALASCRPLYALEVEETDRKVQRLLTGLREMGRLEHAVVVFTSDHGENLGEDGLYYEHGPSVHEASLRVPLVIAGPGIRPTVVEDVVRIDDLTPTILGLAGVPVEEDLDGRDLSALLRGDARPDPGRIVVAEGASRVWLLTRPGGHDRCWGEDRFSLCAAEAGDGRLFDRFEDPHHRRDVSADHPEIYARLSAARERWPEDLYRERAALDGRFKLVRRPRLEGGWSEHLYDLAGQGETLDVAEQHPEEVARLGTALDAWLLHRSGADPMEFDPETRKALQALGYAD